MITTEQRISICVLNGYPKESRDNFDLSGVGHPHDFFIDFLNRYVPSACVTLCFAADFGDILPEGYSVEQFDGIIWTGSDLTIFHLDDGRVTKQIDFAKAVYEVGVPSYGSCWGIQMAAVAAGGEVEKNPRGREWSIGRNIRLTEEGKQALFLRGKPKVYDGFVMHLDEVTKVPEGGTILAYNDHCRVQALEVHHKKGTFWAAQYHPEYNFLEMAKLIAARATPLIAEGFFAQTKEVQRYADDMIALHKDDSNLHLRKKLGVDDDIIDQRIREQELRNWIDHLVMPNL
ncbi:MAG: type 1 glutamine amidotransferase [Desulfofustis sp.]|nr:type 1 glutamine amidotransferase [Desulfofustis sp.]